MHIVAILYIVYKKYYEQDITFVASYKLWKQYYDLFVFIAASEACMCWWNFKPLQ